jgi:hypothetical protein
MTRSMIRDHPLKARIIDRARNFLRAHQPMAAAAE